MENIIQPQAKLLKSRIKWTRYFAVLCVGVLLFCAPRLEWLEEVTEWLGYVCLIIAVAGRVACTMYVGGRKNETLVAEGPYSIVRNPLYVFSFFGVLGLGFITGMMSFLLLLVLAFILYYPHVVAREEAFLHEKFGAVYENYRNRTPAWIPNFKLWNSPPLVSANPRFMMLTLRDATWFLLAFPLVELIEYGHEIGWLPVLAHLY
ncbi:MAG: isoprenylcysteine carboxylmethyltransferase family protein [Alphaproteobacteria bacterium]|nr:MAG: isoprenylcysteine carboxylmethyltransferase family protein [Alphaproteobacteria bacterium]